MGTSTQAWDVAQFIRAQHQEIRQLFSWVEPRHGDDRRQVFEDLVRLLALHEMAEEEALYPFVRTEPGGDEIADTRIAEESDAERMLVDLGNVDVDGDEFPPRFAVLRDSVLRHAASEEATVLPLLERTQDDESLRRMVAAFELV